MTVPSRGTPDDTAALPDPMAVALELAEKGETP